MNRRSDIYHQIAAGKRPANLLVIDNHGHFGTDLTGMPMEREVAETVEVMDASGIDRGVVFYCGTDYRRGNDLTLEGAALAPKRFIAYAYLNADDSRKMLAELERCRAAGMVGLKLHSSWVGAGVKFTDPLWQDVWAYCARYRWPVIIHGMLPCLARANPQTTFIHAHGIEAIRNDEAVQAMRECQNYYWDTSSTMTLMGAVEQAVEWFGSERLLFGSDFPLNNMVTRMGTVLAARIYDADMRKILGGNIARLLGIEV
ncbi:MAG: amidohydrolase family protein [Kiritimatiellae bacterium]|nr:amidohydrolase family protein [Kiritimatiellia bacterium]